MGRRDLMRRELAKLAVADARDEAASGPAAPLPAWLGTGATSESSESTLAGSALARVASARVASTPRPLPAPRRPRDRREISRLPAHPPFESTPLRELVRRRDEARATVRALDTEIEDEVERARATGVPWTDIARCLAITRQGARQRYGPGGTHARPVRTWSTDHR